MTATADRAGHDQAVLPRKLLVHRNYRRLIASAKTDGTYTDVLTRAQRPTWTVVYLDHVDGLPDTESGVLDEDVIKPVNSHDIALDGDWFAGKDEYATGPNLSRKKMSVERYGGGPATYRKGIAGSSDRLAFESWETMVAWSAANGIAPHGWAPDRFGTWVPVGDRRATSATALTPCSESGCGRVGVEIGKVQRTYGRAAEALLCKLHLSHSARRETREAERAERAEAIRAENRERSDRVAAARMWAERLRDEFGVDTEALRASDFVGRVAINPEGLYGLLVSVAAELRELELDVTELVPRELRVRPPAATDE